MSIIIFKKYAGHKLATKACQLAINQLKDRKNIDLVIWDTLPDNKSSISTAEACGFTYVEGASLGNHQVYTYYIDNTAND